MKINKNYVLRKVAGEAMLVPTGSAVAENNGIFMLTETGAFIWEKLLEGVSADEIPELLTEEYDVSPDIAAADTEDFLNSLRGFNIIREE